MVVPERFNTKPVQTTPTHNGKRSEPPPNPYPFPDQQLARWGGIAGMAGAMALIASAVVVGALDLPDASDVATLRDFADIESGRIVEHFLYLGALMLFALHLFALYRLLRPAHQAASLFGTVFAAFGLVIMTASSVLHVSTAPLAELYGSAEATPQDLRAIEYAWHGAQSIFDTMLTTGALLVPIGFIFLAGAMRKAPGFAPWSAVITVVLGLAGTVGAVVAVIDPGSMALAAGVLAIALFHLIIGWPTYRVGAAAPPDLDASPSD